MKKLILAAVFAITFCTAKSQSKPAITDSGTFYLHKFAQHIGKETYYVTTTPRAITYTVNFKFVDRGQAVPLKAKLEVTSGLEPLGLTIKGNVARDARINDSISMRGKTFVRVDEKGTYVTTKGLTFPVAGYAPGTVQQVLLQYWKNHHQPENINTLPQGVVQIKKQGEDTFTFDKKPMVLDRFTISGLIWGNELLWADHSGKMICLITNDAEADKLEMMRDTYESLLPEFISKAAGYSMALFEKAVPKTNADSKIIAVVSGTVVDVVNGTTITEATVLVENGKITKVGKAAEVKIPAGAKVINAKGKTILPGLWDMHAHFEQAEWGPAYLAVGATTVRDCGNEFEYINAVKKAIDGGKGIGPLILKAGIIDGSGPYGLGIVKADTKEEAIKNVDRYYNNGFVQIKIYSSVKPAMVKVICDEAHSKGLTVTGHIPIGMTLQQGVDSGMDMVNHVQYVYSIMKRNKDRSINFDDSTSKAAIKFIKDHHVVIDPTLGVFELSFRSIKDDITQMEPGFYNLPLPLQALFKDTGQDSTGAAKFKPLYDSMVKIVKLLYDNGVTIVAGTDQDFPGYSLDRELELYVGAGLTPMQAIQTATITPAKVMKMDKVSGSIEAGKNADLLIVDGDPLNSIRDIRKVSIVIKAGRVYDPVALHKLVGFAR
ncbi:MAG TPA: amidohydrolase family protein [Mucilaginibacter sp.]|jgi:hypothetical protein|nr:amidohydrolase family protein [Mucilaginibacter sp.]